MRPQLAVLIGAALITSTSGCSRMLYNFGTVQEAEIYRSAQPSPMFLAHLVRTYEIRSIINLRGDTPGFESAFAAEHGLKLFSFDLSASKPPREEDVQRFLAILEDDSNKPLVIHCRNGVDRTGYMVALYRTSVQDWTAARALREMNRHLQFATFNVVPSQVVRDGLRKDD